MDLSQNLDVSIFWEPWYLVSWQKITVTIKPLLTSEIALLLEERRVASVIAVEICDMYCLTKANFDEVLEEHPMMKQILEKIAQQRMVELGIEQEKVNNAAMVKVAAPDEWV